MLRATHQGSIWKKPEPMELSQNPLELRVARPAIGESQRRRVILGHRLLLPQHRRLEGLTT
jgi:hypothetical protein